MVGEYKMKTNVELTKTNYLIFNSTLLLVVVILLTINGCSMSPWMAARMGCASSSNDPWAHSSCVDSADRAYGGPPKDSNSTQAIIDYELYLFEMSLVCRDQPFLKKVDPELQNISVKLYEYDKKIYPKLSCDCFVSVVKKYTNNKEYSIIKKKMAEPIVREAGHSCLTQ